MATRLGRFLDHHNAILAENEAKAWAAENASDEDTFVLPVEGTLELFDSITAMESLITSLEAARDLGYPKERLIELSNRLQSLSGDYPSLETFQLITENATVVSLETLRQSIREAFKAILVMLARFWAQLTDFAHELSHHTVALRTRLGLARAYVREAQGRSPKVDKVDATRLVPQLSREKVIADDPVRVMQNLTVLEHQLSLVRRQYIPLVLEQSQALTNEFSNWTGNSPDIWLSKLNAIAGRFNPAAALHVHGTVDASGVRYGDSLPGHRSVAYTENSAPSEHSSHGNELEWAYYYQQRQVRLETTLEERTDEPFELSVWSQQQLEKVLLQVEYLINEIDRCSRDDARHALRDLTLKLDRMSRNELIVPDGSTLYFQAGLTYIRSISKWTKEPYMALITRAMTVCNCAIRLCNLHVRAYSETSKPKES
jgi:hypothetical protein